MAHALVVHALRHLELPGQRQQRRREALDLAFEKYAHFGRGAQVAAAAQHFQAESGLARRLGSEIRHGTLQGVGCALERARILLGDRRADVGKQFGAIFSEQKGDFFEEIHIAPDAVQDCRAVQKFASFVRFHVLSIGFDGPALYAAMMIAMPGQRIAVHGHRGARAAFPGNTLAAFEYAISAGADYIELDIQASRDGVLVVCHDPVLRRRLYQGPPGGRVVSRLTLAELRRFDCGSLTDRRFPLQAAVPGAHIPTLDEVLALADRGSFHFNIEVKTFPQRPEYGLRPEALAALALEAVGRRGLGRRVQLQSFDLRVLRAIRALDATAPLAALCQFGRRNFLRLAQEAGAATLGPYQRLVTRGSVARAHAAGLRVVPWTANRPRDWARLIRAGVDGIITDDPASLIQYLGRWS